MYLLSDAAFLLSPLLFGLGSAAVFVRKSTICGKKPLSQPPGWVFAVVWPILYILIGLAGALFWRKTKRVWSKPIIGFCIAVAALQLWWILFTKICAPWSALASLIAITCVFVIIASVFAKVSTVSAALLAPLVLWLTFASYLSFEIATGKTLA